MSQKQSNIRGYCLKDCKDKSSYQIVNKIKRNKIAISKNNNNIETEEERTIFTINHKTRENWRAKIKSKD